ncbi:hypothetical protein JTE90_022288 [Oedothorax gibbosus]|uniref:Uncharacterized protein n=1 Tax=Oedothorax gibbosus TaxID=931172 RepID=A0AAV6VVK9_9ARAC|nr:hypothetical protein JTE90_022288 [Oedothorax gibbosus]
MITHTQPRPLIHKQHYPSISTGNLKLQTAKPGQLYNYTNLCNYCLPINMAVAASLISYTHRPIQCNALHYRQRSSFHGIFTCIGGYYSRPLHLGFEERNVSRVGLVLR